MNGCADGAQAYEVVMTRDVRIRRLWANVNYGQLPLDSFIGNEIDST